MYVMNKEKFGNLNKKEVNKLVEVPADSILGLNKLFKEDIRENKINLSIGVIKGGDFKILEKYKDKKEVLGYLSIEGDAEFNKLHTELVLGENHPDVLTYQTLGGTGALSTVGQLLKRIHSEPKIYLPSHTWPNHNNIFESLGYEIKNYKYNVDSILDEKSMLESLSEIPNESIVLFHSCCHNPTGIDPTEKGWLSVIDILKEKGHTVVVDNAYQGLASGDMDKDNYFLKKIYKSGVPFAVCSSHSKNFGLYDKRTGGLIVRLDDDAVDSNVKQIIRSVYSSPPCDGSCIVKGVLKNNDSREELFSEIKDRVEEINDVRSKLYDLLKNKGFEFEQIKTSKGLFCMLDITDKQIERLREEYSIYIVDGGRVNLSALIGEGEKMNYFVECLSKVL